MKPFWAYGRPGKERLIVQAFEATKDTFSWEDEEAAKIAVHKWLMEKGYFSCGTDARKKKKFKDPNFFWARKNYDKYVALLNALLQQEFYKEVEEEAKAYQSALEAQIAEATAQAWEKYKEKWPEYDMIPTQIIETWEDEKTSSFGTWALWASAAFWAGSTLLGAVKGKKK